jgi:arsenate reductase (thioredoxin)
VSQPLKRVLFVCVGNSCRSQMAEAFARFHGSDVLIVASAGLAPAMVVAPDTMQAMLEKGLDLRDHFPKGLWQMGRARFDLVINISGFDLPVSMDAETRTWEVPDPICLDYAEHCEVRDAIERLVLELIKEMRGEKALVAFDA